MNIQTKQITYLNQQKQNTLATVHYVIFNNFDDLKSTIDDEFVDIVHASKIYDLKSTKKEIGKIIASKTDKQKYGLVAEFFAHIVLRNLNFTQECLYKNLEESSMKKGFDGLYEKNSDFWLVESKSSYTKSFHPNKISEAVNDLKSKVESIQHNNPWMNAVHHLLVVQNKLANNSLKNRVEALSAEYQRGITHKLSEFNIIPVSTLFIGNRQNFDDIINALKTIFEGQTYKELLVICIDNYVFDCFIQYLEN